MVRVIDVNKSSLKMYRTENKEELYRNLQQILLPETILTFKEELIAIAENKPYFTIESKDIVAGGEIIDIGLSWTVAPKIENYSRVIVSIIDITERKHAQTIISQYAVEMERRVEERTSELMRSNKELEYANRAKSEFLANRSHELRTPLNSILGFSETLLEKKRGSLNEKQEQYIGLIYSSGEHLLSLINDVLEVSKIEAGKLDVHPDLISIKEVCESSLNFVKTTAMKKSITLEYINEQFISTIRADPQRLKQILVNLLNNAVKFTPEKGKVLLEIHTNAERERIQFSVTDNGIGIAHEDLKKLFTPFTQLDSSLSRQYEGTGLGLVIVYKLTELHGGSVQVESEPGKGSCFTVILPWNENQSTVKDQGTKTPIAAEAMSRPASNSGDQGVILLAEDNMANVLTIQEYLADQGYKVVVTHNGVEAIARAKEVSPKIILMDIQMPEMDGLEAIRRLRSTPQFASVPIIALTALAMPGDRERCLETGANEYMSKPISLKLLVNTIDGLLERKK
jgi:signal transduction histidine kinase/CheY-like chemotaxis protein